MYFYYYRGDIQYTTEGPRDQHEQREMDGDGHTLVLAARGAMDEWT